jgi:hypothetical protein
MQKLVPDTQLADDLATGNGPNSAYIAPAQCHDMRGQSGCGGAQSFAETDQYLKTVDEIMH